MLCALEIAGERAARIKHSQAIELLEMCFGNLLVHQPLAVGDEAYACDFIWLISQRPSVESTSNSQYLVATNRLNESMACCA